MIRTHSDDPDVEAAARQAATIIDDVLRGLPSAGEFDYGGHHMQLGDYEVCVQCTAPIAEAQQAHDALIAKTKDISDPEVREHLELAAQLFSAEAAAAQIRAQLHNGRGSEKIVNILLTYIYERGIHDSYEHSHHGSAA